MEWRKFVHDFRTCNRYFFLASFTFFASFNTRGTALGRILVRIRALIQNTFEVFSESVEILATRQRSFKKNHYLFTNIKKGISINNLRIKTSQKWLLNWSVGILLKSIAFWAQKLHQVDCWFRLEFRFCLKRPL